MNRLALTVTALLLATSAVDAQTETVRIEQLRQDVAQLNRTVREQAQRIERLEREITRLRSQASGRKPRSGAGGDAPSDADVDAPWLTSAAWDQLRVGMPEREVLARLGPPTAVRAGEQPAVKVLLYTLELSGTGFLSGSVELASDRITAISKPQLR